MQRKSTRRDPHVGLRNPKYQTYLAVHQQKALELVAEMRKVPETELVRDAIDKYLANCTEIRALIGK